MTMEHHTCRTTWNVQQSSAAGVRPGSIEGVCVLSLLSLSPSIPIHQTLETSPLCTRLLLHCTLQTAACVILSEVAYSSWRVQSCASQTVRALSPARASRWLQVTCMKSNILVEDITWILQKTTSQKSLTRGRHVYSPDSSLALAEVKFVNSLISITLRSRLNRRPNLLTRYPRRLCTQEANSRPETMKSVLYPGQDQAYRQMPLSHEDL